MNSNPDDGQVHQSWPHDNRACGIGLDTGCLLAQRQEVPAPATCAAPAAAGDFTYGGIQPRHLSPQFDGVHFAHDNPRCTLRS